METVGEVARAGGGLGGTACATYSACSGAMYLRASAGMASICAFVELGHVLALEVELVMLGEQLAGSCRDMRTRRRGRSRRHRARTRVASSSMCS